ncbi:MAG TPA: cytochrome c [Anaerolineae bacterium]|nr:cytochrome c [Anaerolineae bacterium]
MTTRIFVGAVLFVLIFIVVGYVLLTEGLFDVQAQAGSGRMQVFKTGQDGRYLENGASLFDQYCDECHGVKGEGVSGRGPQLNPYLFTTRYPELKAANYPNTLANFVKLTISAGRPVFSTYWSDKGEVYAQNMPTWSARYGGPLRDDQIEYLTSYIMSWEVSAGQPAPIEFEAIGPDVTVELPAGDAERGRRLWSRELALASGKPAPCNACHSLQEGQTLVGPSLAGIGARAANTVPDQDAATYLRHSIQLPNEHIVTGGNFTTPDGQSLMPGTLGNDMSAQDLADLIAYLLTLQ